MNQDRKTVKMSVDQCKRSLIAYKGHLTRAINESETLLEKVSVRPIEVKGCIEFLQTRWSSYDAAYFKLESALLEGECEDEDLEKVQVEYYELKANYQQNLYALTDKETPDHAGITTEQPQTPCSSTKPKLPTIQLPTFSGSLDEYEPFIDQFQVQIGNRTDLEPVTKLHYLKAQLKGKPLELIQGYTSINDNYQNALDTLKDTYGDEEKVKHHILQKMVKVNSPKHSKADLETFRISMLNLTRSLQNKHNYDCCEWIIASIFQHKLATPTIRQLYLKYDSNYFTLHQLNEGLREMISHMEVEIISKDEKISDTKKTNTDHYKGKPVGTYYNLNSQSKTKPLADIQCKLCKAPHQEAQCTKFSTGQERIQRLKALHLCLRCMGNHHIDQCYTQLQPCRKCQRGRHHTALCKTYDKQTATLNADKHPTVTQGSVNTVKVIGDVTNTGVALPTAKATLEHQGKVKNVRLFFDTGSQRTFITQEVVDDLKLPITDTLEMTLTGFMSTPNTRQFNIVRPLLKMGKRFRKITAVVVEELPRSITTVGLTDVTHRLQRDGINLADPVIENDRVGPVDILIGCDHYYDFIYPESTQYRKINLLKSPTGYIIAGKLPHRYRDSRIRVTTENVTQESVIVMRITNNFNPVEATEATLEQDPPIYKLWDLDVIGIDATKPLPEESTAYQDYLETVTYEDDQYWVKLPWKINKPELPNNYSQALGQMYSLVKELERKDKITQYDDIIKEQLRNKFIEEVPAASPIGESHYLPHHAVFKDSVSTPLRIVFNCSARAKGKTASLNDCLMTGPSLTNKLGEVLLKFRTNPYAYTADISKAFLRIGLHKEDRDFTRFLWPADITHPDHQVKTYRFRSVLFGATSSPFLLQATIDHHLRKSNSPLKDVLIENFYVDNFQGTTVDESKLFAVYREANKELQKANMPLRQWSTNSKNLQKIITDEFPGYNIPRVNSILGLLWDTEEDVLRIKQPQYTNIETTELTKRSLLAEISKLFDPLGFFSPVTIKGKLLMQEAWKLKIDWDDSLPEEVKNEWRSLQTELKELQQVSLPRATACENEGCTLHVFCDASSKAYGAAAYLVTSTRSSLLTSRARVTPIKSRTIPQLELTALLLGTKLAYHVLHTLKLTIRETYIWSDNEAALQWIKYDNSKLPYVKNRVAEIHELQKDFKFLHVPTQSNPADLLSRGTAKDKLDELWFHGPKWLQDNQEWPEQKKIVVSSIEMQQTAKIPSDRRSPSVIQANKYSSLNKLIRVTSFVFRFIRNIYKKRGWNEPDSLSNPTQYWIKEVQSDYYQEEHRILSSLRSTLHSHSTAMSSGQTPTKHYPDISKGSRGVHRNNKLIKNLGLFLDDEGVIRCQGRIHNSTLRYGARYPVLLPKTHWLTQLIIHNAHQVTLHGGVAETMINIRKSFWIPQIRQAIKMSIRKCVICRRYDAKTLPYPTPPTLPVERIKETKPFQVTGIDYTGALYLRAPSVHTDGDPTPVYICLFTCATTRAVHLELVTDLSTQTFLQAFRRFTGRRSCPRLIITDNATNFKAAEVFLKKYFNNSEVQAFLDSRQCEWKFIPPKAPWQGGFYERLIGILKRCLRKVLHNKRITVEELRTLIVEIEARINNRPLTYVWNEIDEPEALTPNHLLQGSTIDVIPPVIDCEWKTDPDFHLRLKNVTSEDLVARYTYLNKLLRLWNNTWRNDYLTSLREHHRGTHNDKDTCSLKPGDLVLIDCGTGRSSWSMGKIVSLLPDKKGIVRVVKVLSQGRTSLRTIDKLIPLEISTEPAEEIRKNVKRRPVRAAAERARVQLKDQGIKGLI